MSNTNTAASNRPYVSPMLWARVARAIANVRVRTGERKTMNKWLDEAIREKLSREGEPVTVETEGD